MSTKRKVRIKICCIKSVAEAEMAIKAGANALGLVSEMPSGPGPIAEATIAEIAATVPPGVATFLLTSKLTAQEIIDQALRCGCNTLQLVDAVDHSVYGEIRKKLPLVKIVQVIHIVGEESIQQAMEVDPLVDAILLDSGNPNAAVKELGGTGRVHNWEVSAELVRQVKSPVYLAGGLKADNVRQAIEMVKPFGLDLCSGLRTDDRLDQEKVSAFMNIARG